jgi:MoaA/NifB/PqqE/SkfB family radical SAM enzyme
MGTKSLYFVGSGEPLLHPRLFDFVAQAKAGGMHVKLVTNGTLLNETRIDALLACPPDELRVSLWASTPAEYAQHYPGTKPENFRRVVEGMQLLAKKKAQSGRKLPEVVLKRVITRHNYQNLEALIHLAQETGVDRLEFSSLRNFGGRVADAALSPEEEREICRSLQELHAQRPGLFPKKSLDRILTRYRLGEEVARKLPCYRGWLLTDLRVDGTIRVCSSFNQVMGNLHEDSLPVIWNGPRYRAFRRRTFTPEGQASLGHLCDCGFCGFVMENLKVHRLFKWVAFLKRPKSGPGNF